VHLIHVFVCIYSCVCHIYVSGEGEELMIPGDKQEMAEFIDYASHNSRIQLEITLPCASMQLCSKHLYELIYNR
jgi:hypothetical protein